MGRMRGMWEGSARARVRLDVVTAPDEERLLGHLTEESYAEVRMHGQVARRTVHHHGMSYDFEARGHHHAVDVSEVILCPRGDTLHTHHASWLPVEPAPHTRPAAGEPPPWREACSAGAEQGDGPPVSD
jgi:hypothetical protein